MQVFVVAFHCFLFLLISFSSSVSAEIINWENSKKSLFDARYEIAAIAGGITYLGVKEWNWGSSSFNFNNEDWFGMETGSGGMDKLGHMYASYVITEVISNGLSRENEANVAAAYSALWGGGLMMYVEMFDGFSSDHGFSYEDVIFNSSGIALSYLRTLNPKLKNLVDYRIDYRPSKEMKGFHPFTDYGGMRYLLAVKAAGIPSLKDTPLKYFELNFGYMAQGFKVKNAERNSEVFIGVSVNLDKLLFKPFRSRLKRTGKFASTFFHYYQPRFSYVKMTLDKRSN
ncbi:DUF2279 domain-containing protein [Microbulbifer variabilis]|uniref:DUF2279 domain-containing protein n=1 Tax=Microbulbifer variabilis TaxID=266805 RepID=UPI001CFE8AD7|nr:DUF2279 domain-containing protein [Microbulbifer variabilis]